MPALHCERRVVSLGRRLLLVSLRTHDGTTRLKKKIQPSIHDPALKWVPPPADRGSSGRSTPSSTTLVSGAYKPSAPNTNGTAEPGPTLRSSSSQSAHCWGYIQGLCPHPGNTCKFLHPANVVPCTCYRIFTLRTPLSLTKRAYHYHTQI